MDTDEVRKNQLRQAELAFLAGVVMFVASLLVLQKALHLTGDSSVVWAIPCAFIGIASYNAFRPRQQMPGSALTTLT